MKIELNESEMAGALGTIVAIALALIVFLVIRGCDERDKAAKAEFNRPYVPGLK